MSSISLDNLISEFPEDRDAIKSFEYAFETGLLSEEKDYPVKRIYDLIHPRSQLALAKILNRLVEEGILRKIVRIESPETGGGLEDFDDILNVPSEIHDWRRDVDMQVTLDDLKIIYKVLSDSNQSK